MVEELIAEGYTREQVTDLYVEQFGLSRGDAEMLVATALGEPGDVIVEELDELVPDEEPLGRSSYDESKHPRDPGGEHGGEWIAKGTSAAGATLKWKKAADGYEAGDWQLLDNGAGLGPAKGSGRWAVMQEGRWIANVDTLAEAKAYAVEGATARAASDALAALAPDYDRDLAYWHYDPSARTIQEYLATGVDSEVNPYDYGAMKASEAHAMLLAKVQPLPAVTLWHGGDPIASGELQTWKSATPFRAVAEAFGENPIQIEVAAGTPGLLMNASPGGLRREVLEVVLPPGTKLNVRDGVATTSSRSTWDESKHPRDPGGEHGGEFIAKGTSAAGKPQFKLVAPGDYETADGRYRLYKLVGVHPPAWNVEDTETGALLVDGAASMKDAIGLAEDSLPSVPTGVTITGSRVSVGIPSVAIVPTIMENHYGDKAEIYDFVADGGVANPLTYTNGHGLMVKKNGEVGKQTTTSFKPKDGIPQNVKDELVRLAEEHKRLHPG